MATLHLPEKTAADSPFITRRFVLSSRHTVNNTTNFTNIIMPLVAPLVTGSLAGWELVSHALPMGNLVGKYIIALIAVIVLEFSGIMFFNYIAQVGQYNIKKPKDYVPISPYWGWAAILSYLSVSAMLVSTGTVIPAIFKFMGYTSDVRLLSPAILPGFIILCFFGFKTHQDMTIIEAVYDQVDKEAKAEQVARQVELSQQESELRFLRQKARLERTQAETSVMLLAAETEKIKAVNTVSTLQQVDGLVSIAPKSKLSRAELVSARAKLAELVATNPDCSSRKLETLMDEAGYPVSHTTISNWINKGLTAHVE